MFKFRLKSLRQAIKSQNIKKLRKILSKHPELSHSTKEKYSPLWDAMILGYEKVVELLLEFGADPDEKCRDENVLFTGYTFLQYLASLSKFSLKNFKIAEVLVRYKADVNVSHKCRTGNPIQIALANGNVNFIEFLLKNGVDFQSGPDWYDVSPAAYTFANKDTSTCKKKLQLLFEHGMDPTFHNELGENILHTFIDFEDRVVDAVQISRVLLDAGVPVNGMNEKGFSPLHCAILKTDLKLIEFLIKRGADVNMMCEGEGCYPLGLAVETEREDIVELLLSNGADVNVDEVLETACWFGKNKILGLLLEYRADISLEFYNGERAFAYLVSSGKYKHCIETMIKHFSKLSFENMSVQEIDMDIIKSRPDLQKFFDDCTVELEKMKNTKFFKHYSYYWLLGMSKNLEHLARRTKDKQFVAAFERNLSFTIYEENLRRIFKRALQLRDNAVIVQLRLNYIFRGIFPKLVTEKLAESLTLEDLPTQ